MKNKDRYCISYVDHNERWSEITARTKDEALALYDMIGDEATFKVVYDVVSGEQIAQT
jgi:hypothetical protein